MWFIDRIRKNRRRRMTYEIADSISSIIEDGSVVFMNESNFMDSEQIREVMEVSNMRAMVSVRANVSQGIVVFHGECR